MANASYAARQPPAVEGEKPVHVLVTGFGPFLNKYPKNSSWEIASTLPALIPVSSGNPTPIHIHVHHEPIRVAYQNVVSAIPKLLSKTPQPDIILHIGLAAGRKFYAIEQGAHARGYGKTNDVDGALFPDSEAQKLFPDSQYPSILHTGFDTEDVLSRWRTSLGCTGLDGSPSIEQLPDVRINPDAGNFMCGFIYYNSLAWYNANSISSTTLNPHSTSNANEVDHSDTPQSTSEGSKSEKPVMFMHVPDLSGSEERLREGWEVAVALIKALVESRRKVGVGSGERGKGEREGVGEQEDDRRNNTAA